MNKDTAQGSWEELKGKMKQKWAKLGDMDLELYNTGKRQEFIGKMQNAYGKTKEEAEREIKAFEESCGCSNRAA